MRKTFLLLGIGLLLPASAFAQIDWVQNLDRGLDEARDRDAPIFAFYWEYN
jgi:hypothetical protein